MKDFIVANGIVRYKPGIIRYQQHDVAKNAEKIIAFRIEDMKKMEEIKTRFDLLRFHESCIIMNNEFDGSKKNVINMLNVNPPDAKFKEQQRMQECIKLGERIADALRFF